MRYNENDSYIENLPKPLENRPCLDANWPFSAPTRPEMRPHVGAHGLMRRSKAYSFSSRVAVEPILPMGSPKIRPMCSSESR